MKYGGSQKGSCLEVRKVMNKEICGAGALRSQGGA